MQIVNAAVKLARESSFLHLFLNMTEQNMIDGLIKAHGLEHFLKKAYISISKLQVIIEHVQISVNDSLLVASLESLFKHRAIQVGGSKQEVSALCHLKESFELVPFATLGDEVEEAADHFGSGVN